MSQPTQNTARFRPQQAQYFDLLNAEFQFTPDELAMLEQNGFVLTERLKFEQFKRAYAWIYWKDLPVLVTTDAILHTIHQTYDELLKQVESTILTHKLIEILQHTRATLSQAAPTAPDSLKEIYADLDIYLSVPLLLLSGLGMRSFYREEENEAIPVPEQVRSWLAQIVQINHLGGGTSISKDGELIFHDEIPVGIETVTLFGLSREVDFTQFQARGHYDEMVSYFCAMMWLQLIDFRFVSVDSWGISHLQRDQLVAAHLLRDAITQAGQRDTWESIDKLLTAFAGWSDLITLNGLDRLIKDAQVQSPLDWHDIDEAKLLEQIAQTDYGHQRIRGMGQSRARDLEGILPHNVSFAFMGQRYTIESDIMQQLVFDKLRVNDQVVRRAYPSAMDVMYSLGNDRALTHLQGELEKFGYTDALSELRRWASTHSEEFWQSTFYNRWLHAILTLNQDTSGSEYPSMMRSPAWHDKTLHTQLGSWAQLRHDNILYVKPPYSPACVCEYPTGYVEPYPAFYRALGTYAQMGREVFANLTLEDPGETFEAAQKRLGGYWYKHLDEIRPQQAFSVHQTALSYFDHLQETMAKLEQLAQKELARQPFSEEDTLFLRSIIVRKYIGDSGYGGVKEERWDGWYNALLPFGDKTTRLVADIHTNYNAQIGDIGVLHLGMSDPALLLGLVECDGQETFYVGAAFTLYEHLEKSNPPHRLTDDEWYGHVSYKSETMLRERIQHYHKVIDAIGDETEKSRAQIATFKSRIAQAEEELEHPLRPPAWTHTFRLATQPTKHLELPNAYDDLIASLSPQVRTFMEMLAEKDKIQSHWGVPSVEAIASFVKTQPDALLRAKGFDQAMLDELVTVLKNKGHVVD